MPELNFEAIAVMLLGVVVQATDDQVNQQVDKAAQKTIDAVNSSATQIDDILAKRVAAALERYAAAVKAGV